ncbi:MAG: hypothetical protein J6R02_03985, partial [Alistipes sp.]|nr:hypothetical protein [Alistipes sp.]
MKSLRVYICLCVAMIMANFAYAQSGNMDNYRTRMLPYPTSDAAHKGGVTPNRYLQIIDQWQEVDGVLQGEFTFPFSWLERQVFVRIEGCMMPYKLFINGKLACESTNGFVAKEINITKLSKEDKNRVELRLAESNKMQDIECFERGATHPIVYVISQPRVRVRDVSWRTNIEKGGVVNADFNVIMHNETLGDKTSRLYYELYVNDTTRLTGGSLDVALGMYGVDTMRFGAPVPDSVLWSAESPTRISMRLKNRIGGRDVEFYEFDLALREMRYDNGVYYINNVKQDFAWHEVSPRVSVEELNGLYTSGVRAIRFTAGFVRDELLEFCDEKGIYVAVTAPINSSLSGTSRKRGGNPSNKPSLRDEYVERILSAIRTTKRYP